MDMCATPFLAGAAVAAVAATALAGRYTVQAWQKFDEGGFQPTMTRREKLISFFGSVAAEKAKEAHRKVMVANLPDAGAKDVMLGKSKGGGSPF
ncbi:hypothetical protein Bca52824_028872 [Brassica carinata]|uniref:Uncharacterized protein n=1 Tax=Brassica carinata TaxID=52824 RepID=A0A8X7VDK0_BRACI|nr:hypothetical protein Bca52824_028872 [Brassica carinata]